MLSQRALEAFRAVMSAGTVSGAADMLNVSQPAVSRLLRDLEQDLSMNLFLRMGGRIVPTPEARELIAEVERAFIGLDSIERAAGDIRAGRRASLSVAAMPTLSQTLLPDALCALHRDRPDARIELASMRTHNVVRQVASRQAQLGFTSPTRHQFEIDLIRTYEFGYRCVMPAGHPLAARAVLGVEDFAGIDFVGFTENTASGLIQARRFAAMRVPPRITLRSHLSPIISAMVLRGIGVGIIDPFSARQHETLGGVSRPVDFDERFAISVIRPLGERAGPDAEALLEIVDGLVAEIDTETALPAPSAPSAPQPATAQPATAQPSTAT